MKQFTVVLAIIVLGISQAAALAFECPAGVIFCDSFDTYCLDGGFPVPETPICTGEPVKTEGNPLLFQVWANTPINNAGLMLEETQTPQCFEGFSAARFITQFNLGQKTVRDWVDSPAQGQPGQIYDLRRFIAEALGNDQFSAVNGTDSAPLTMEFMLGADVEKLFFGSGFMELAYAFGPDAVVDADNLNRANTDYVSIASCCGGAITPFQVICAQGNPDPATPVPAGCPSVALIPPPVHKAIAVGQFSHLDLDPCNCSPLTTHRQKVTHLALFDGQVWWTLKKPGEGVVLPPGVVVTGSITALDGGPTDPLPADLLADASAGNFRLSSSLKLHPEDPDCPVSNSLNAVKLTIKQNTIKVELNTRIIASIANPVPDPEVPYLYYWYNVYSSMDNIPRKYTGAFNRARMGVGQGCELDSNTDWAACEGGGTRTDIYVPYGLSRGYFIDFDNFVLQGGAGIAVPGACCKADGSCSEMLQDDCEALDLNGNPIGHFMGDGLPCDESIHCCPLIYGDTDNDGYVDMDDFAKLQTCLTTGGGSISDSCRCLDFDSSNNIDDQDVLHFAQCANGPSIPGNLQAPCKGVGW